MKLVGTVIAADYATGSKSQRRAVFLQTQSQKLLLRNSGGNAMHDSTLEQFVGHSVEVEGELHQNVLMAREIRRLI